ncbi:hypothetical protein FDP41_011510 [Naegleria fowleri]|uniref:Uncharacterized protein n=1 Tax=Naegleria fowleri TaxID=5763 RepID=A0A6A5CA59_NAEFO|nr:uncharacterized protein FDP41_011510 [Naegleria fowleri]KAF0982580.1 hypothetical protein FDP41_011510 [Naegleria fowleri]
MIASTNSRSREDQQDQQPTTTTITDTTNKENSPFFIDDEYKLRMTRGEEEEEDFPEMVDHVFNYARLVSDTSKMYQLKNYYAGASNGFVRVYTAEGHKYWLAQAMTTHRAPDFKVHFSVEIEDIPKAFDILAKHFFLSRCKFGMKAYMLKDWKDKHASEIAQYSETVSSVSELSVERSSVENSILLNSNVKSEDQSRVSSLSIDSGWPEHMRGREITVYIYRYYDLQKHHTIREYGEGGLFKEYPIHVKTENNPYYKSHFMEYQHMHPFEMFELEKKA